MPKNEVEKKRITLRDIEKRTKEIYLLADDNIIDILAMVLISHHLPLDPIWLSLVAPSAGGKTEAINAISKIPVVYPMSTLTGKTFISGARGVAGTETSLLFKVSNHILAFKDLTSILNEHKDDRTAIMNQLREIYDGSYKKEFGTGQTIEWKGRLTLLAGCTFAIHTLRQNYAAMGERILLYNLRQPDRIEQAIRAMENQESGKFMAQRAEIQQMWTQWFSFMMNELTPLLENLPTLEIELKRELADLSEFSTRARSETERDWRSTNKEMTEAHDPEMPGRMGSQIMNAALSFMLLNKMEGGKLELTLKHKKILETIALDSITKLKRKCLVELTKYDVINTAGLATKMNFPTPTIRRSLEDLNALGIIDRQKGTGAKGDNWVLREKYRLLMERYEGIEHIGGELDEKTAEPDQAMLEEAEQIRAEEEALEKGREDQELL